MGKIFPSKVQWANWSLPSKATYIGTGLGILGILIAVGFGIYSIFSSTNINLTVVTPDPSKTETINCEQSDDSQCPLNLVAFTYKEPHSAGSDNVGLVANGVGPS